MAARMRRVEERAWTARLSALLLLLPFAMLVLASCSFDRNEHPDACDNDDACTAGKRCVQGFCVRVDGGARDGGAGGGSDGAGPDGARADGSAECVETGVPEDCYDGPAGTGDEGICRAGQRLCVGGRFTQCLGQVTPDAEDCNQLDDDCDGEVDEIDDASCETAMQGSCMEGRLVCRGSFAVCEPVAMPVDESCNGRDDDCDGETDEVAEGECYPQADGCTPAGDGFLCLGLCQPGERRCEGGSQECRNAQLPVDEECTGGGGSPEDEDCDGQVDEGCPCTGGDSRDCYPGPPGTEDEGACEAGTQRCEAGRWGDCEGPVLPQPETCLNPGEDDDCDGTIDNVPGIGEACIAGSAQGQCRLGARQCSDDEAALVCLPGEPNDEQCDALDRDCDGDPYNGFDFQSDETCGDCDTQCTNQRSCCGGTCRAPAFFEDNDQHCGECNNRCGDAAICCQGACVPYAVGAIVLVGGIDAAECACEHTCSEGKVCCGTECVDLDSDPDNCGACGRACTGIGGARENLCREGSCNLL